MLFRRALALTTIFCLLIGLMAVPRGPILVCRITGTPMAPVAVPEVRPGDSCCTITVSGDSNGSGAPRYALASPGCCELRQDQSRAVAPAVTPDSPEIPAVALLPNVSAPPSPGFVALAAASVAPRESAPRAPPLSFSSPRAPPVFS
jgi:hypothetical protein